MIPEKDPDPRTLEGLLAFLNQAAAAIAIGIAFAVCLGILTWLFP
jgi:hypothetical protein